MNAAISSRVACSRVSSAFPRFGLAASPAPASSTSTSRRSLTKEGSAASSKSMPRTTWARAGRRIARSRPCAATIRCRCTASACRSEVRSRSTRRILRASARWSNATSPRWCPSISPGRRTRPPTSTICCRCPTPRRRSSVSAIISTRCRKRSGGRCCWKIRRPIVAFRESTMSETDFIRRVARAHRMRPAARHQQCVRVRDQSRFLRTGISLRLSACSRRRDPSRRPCRADRRRRRAAADRQPRRPGRGCRVEAVRDRHQAVWSRPDADRVGQQDSRLAGPEG